MGINDVNQLYLSGEVQGVPVFDHSAYGEEFFCAFLCCRRLSGTVDTLPVLAPQPLAVQLRPAPITNMPVQTHICDCARLRSRSLPQ